MYVDAVSNVSYGRKYTRHLLRESYRENGHVRKRTIANISHCSPDEIQAITLALKHKADLHALGDINQDLRVRQGLAFGAVWTLWVLAQRMGIVHALGNDARGRYALWQVFARVIGQGSRLSAVRLAAAHAACDVLKLEPFDEDDLYGNLDWLAERQDAIEDRLFRFQQPDRKSDLFLYDVTSSYLEGTDNDLAAFGYQRDGKKGKRQIVYGLLCDDHGEPVSIQAFAGNTADTVTFGDQIDKLAERFAAGHVTIVGDRGMIKGPQIQRLGEQTGLTCHYITAITRSQIATLLQRGVLNMSLFDEQIAEVTDQEGGVRYILRRNPVRAEEIANNRQDKLDSVTRLVQQRNRYLAEHDKARIQTAQRQVEARITRLKMPAVQLRVQGRSLEVVPDADAWREAARLDGCYCIKTDLSGEQASAQVVHDRYKDLANVEWAFRTMKTTHLEARPVYVRRASRTRGHLLVVMLAYRLARALRHCWRKLEITVEEGLSELAGLCLHEVRIKDRVVVGNVPVPRRSVQALLDAADVVLPKAVETRGVRVSTRKKLVNERVK